MSLDAPLDALNDKALTCQTCVANGVARPMRFRGRKALERHLDTHGKIQVPSREKENA